MTRRAVVESVGGFICGVIAKLALMMALSSPSTLLAQVVHTTTDVPCAVENLQIS